ncbi:hypothetical protein ARMSODRAFT_980837 [Armillaria solidipes]|uniref:Uncharacterized protein n=1 Tax=Armillaria solidipes TaxID=1076256 RepID=A0A2H3ATZ2_9AGAR|nr:hypothetical protein ARMSODRAFT_980837 [Armillaria solidipes]
MTQSKEYSIVLINAKDTKARQRGVIQDAACEDLCIKAAERRGYAIDVLRPYLTAGFNSTAAAYNHLVNVNIKLYIVFFTAFVTYLYDVYPDDPDALHILSSEKQPSKMLNNFANLLAEVLQLLWPSHHNFIGHASLKFITGLVLEILSKDEPMTDAPKCHIFSRAKRNSGIFPTELPSIICDQTLPLLRDAINFTNDITSFYKEYPLDVIIEQGVPYEVHIGLHSAGYNAPLARDPASTIMSTGLYNLRTFSQQCVDWIMYKCEEHERMMYSISPFISCLPVGGKKENPRTLTGNLSFRKTPRTSFDDMSSGFMNRTRLLLPKLTRGNVFPPS